MKRRSVLAALAALATAAPALLAQCPLFITGPVPTGFNCTYSNVDVVIQDVQIDPNAATNRTFTLTVYNGSITILGYGGLNGTGADGTGAVAHFPCDAVGEDAKPPKPGCTIKLSSLKDPTAPTTRPLGIFGGSITTSGGRGGDGDANPSDDMRWNICTLCAGGDALPPTDGAPGGNVTLLSDGPISVGGITASGGAGGAGADAPDTVWSGAGAPSAGGAGGAGGKITITQNGADPGPAFSYPLSAPGGDGAPGGEGGTGVQGSSMGAPGGNGGAGGTLTISGPAPAILAINTRGGGAGTGGAGGDAVPFDFYLCDQCPPPHSAWLNTCAVVQTGRVGGNGGKGGPGGPVSITTLGDASIGGYGAYVTTHGGSGATGGLGGHGDEGWHGCPPCPVPPGWEGPDQTVCPARSVHGTPGDSGAGGAGGSFSVKAHSFLAANVPIITVGGCGGDGNHGDPAVCVERARYRIPTNPPQYVGHVPCDDIPATPGASGGAGGNSGNISLTLTIPLAQPYPAFSYCGGNGGRGGQGGGGYTCVDWWGGAPGAGGLGGPAGGSGTLSAPGIFSYCTVPADYTGECGVPQVQDYTGQYRGQPGLPGAVDPTCHCANDG